MPKKSKPIQHRAPTSAVLKELYANAYCCAYPSCPRPLYKVDGESGVRTLNSNASHICARSEGGPRWDENQSETENRSVKNLLALCLEHAKEVDDIKKVTQFSTEKLVAWKNQQLADFDALGKQGWSIRDEDLGKLNQHFNIVETIVSNSIIDLGGKGGSAPGAGGGGGGVLGSSNSKGGDGGKGGDTIILKGKDAIASGAGGGGAGVIGEGALACDGGEGGEKIETTLNLKNVHQLAFTIGSGGKSGQDGTDTVVNLVDKDGVILDTIRAKGGKTGRSGHHGDVSEFARSITRTELELGAGISSIILTDFYRFKSGLFTLLEAGWEVYRVSSLPCIAEWPLLLVFSVVGLAIPTVIDCVVKIISPENKVIVEQKIHFTRLDSNVLRVSWAEVFKFELTQSGIWTIEVSSGDLVLEKLPITVLPPENRQ